MSIHDLYISGNQLKYKDWDSGKLFCCCEPPPPPIPCCLYPRYNVSFYPPEDLPETLVASDGPAPFTLTKTSGYRYEGVRPGNDFSDPQPVYIKPGDDGYWWYGEIVDGEDDPYIWRSNCLIGDGWSGIVIEDQFPDTLILGYSGMPETCELLRVSLCCWEGVFEYTAVGELHQVPMALCYFESIDLPAGYDQGWYLFPTYSGEILYRKDDPQSGPEGNYEDEWGYYIVTS